MKWLISKIKNLFRGNSDYREHSTVINDYGSGEETTYNWGYIVPHTKATGGATNGDGSLREYDYGLTVAKLNRAAIPFDTRDSGGVKGAAKRLIKVGATASIEAHLNSYNKKVKGAEILVMKGDAASIEAAENLLAAFALAFPSHTIRGVKKKRKGDRGFYNLNQARKAGMKIRLLTEFFFIDSEFISEKDMADFLADNLT